MRPQLKHIIAWHPVLTDHQAFTYLELSRQSELPITVNVARFEDATRRAQGWLDTRVTAVERKTIPERGFIRHCLKLLLESRDQIHIFGSVFEMRKMTVVLWLALLLRIEVYIISEPYSHVPFGYLSDKSSWRERLKARLRPLLYRLYVF